MSSNIEDLKDTRFWRAAVGECFGVLILVFIGCGTCLGGEKEWEKNVPSTVQISLAFGLAVATVVWCLAHVSGGHVNPAVTIAFLITRRISLVRAVLFVLAQCVGATAGAALLYLLTPENVRGDIGLTSVIDPLTVPQAFGVELVITFVLVFTVFASVDPSRRDLNGSAPLTIGLSVSLCHLCAIKYTGSSMNPARTFGPTVVSGLWKNHWVYWAGPVAGGILAGILYEFVFAANASPSKLRGYICSSTYECADYAGPQPAVVAPGNEHASSRRVQNSETLEFELNKGSLLRVNSDDNERGF